MECWKAFIAIEWFILIIHTYKHGKHSEFLIMNSFGLAYFGEVAQIIGFKQ